MTATTDSPLWRPDAGRVASANITAFRERLASRLGQPLDDFAALHTSSVTDPVAFWSELWRFSGVVGEQGSRVVEHPDRMPGARFFPDARLNFAENVVRRTDDEPAILAETETGRTQTISWAELRRDVARAAAALRRMGVGVGDRVGAVVANVPEAMISALAASAIGAVWSSCSPDFGVQGILDRFGQIEPAVLVAVDGYWYGGKT